MHLANDSDHIKLHQLKVSLLVSSPQIIIIYCSSPHVYRTFELSAHCFGFPAHNSTLIDLGSHCCVQWIHLDNPTVRYIGPNNRQTKLATSWWSTLQHKQIVIEHFPGKGPDIFLRSWWTKMKLTGRECWMYIHQVVKHMTLNRS